MECHWVALYVQEDCALSIWVSSSWRTLLPNITALTPLRLRCAPVAPSPPPPPPNSLLLDLVEQLATFRDHMGRNKKEEMSLSSMPACLVCTLNCGEGLRRQANIMSNICHLPSTSATREWLQTWTLGVHFLTSTKVTLTCCLMEWVIK